jgi:hypothetical protein
MRRLLSIGIAALVAVALVPVAQPQQGAKKRTITVVSETRVSIPHDLAPKGTENKGDWFQYQALLLATAPLFGKKAGIPVGWDKGTLQYTSRTATRINGTAHFPGQGSIKYRGRMKELANGSTTVPIVGGSGKFADANGVMTIGPGNREATNVFRFTVPGAVA